MTVWECDSVGESSDSAGVTVGDKFKAIQASTQDVKLAARGDQINQYPNGEKCCIMLESGLTHSLVAKLAVCEFHATK